MSYEFSLVLAGVLIVDCTFDADRVRCIQFVLRFAVAESLLDLPVKLVFVK